MIIDTIVSFIPAVVYNRAITEEAKRVDAKLVDCFAIPVQDDLVFDVDGTGSIRITTVTRQSQGNSYVQSFLR